MPQVQKSVVIERSPREIFAAVADPEVQMRYDDEIRSFEKVTPGAIGKGTRYRGDFKGMGKVEYEYSSFEPDRVIEYAVRLPLGAVRHRFEIVTQGGGARLTQTIDLEPSLVGRILWPLVARRMVSRRLASLNALIKRYVEAPERSFRRSSV